MLQPLILLAVWTTTFAPPMPQEALLSQEADLSSAAQFLDQTRLRVSGEVQSLTDRRNALREELNRIEAELARWQRLAEALDPNEVRFDLPAKPEPTAKPDPDTSPEDDAGEPEENSSQG